MAITETQILETLKTMIDPDLGRDIVSLGFVQDIKIDGNKVSFTIELTTPACPVKEQFEQEARQKVEALPGVEAVEVMMTSKVPQAPVSSSNESLSGVKHVVAVASGKGGVGKSTVSVNLAAALASQGATVGLLDADIYGPSIPIMMGLKAARPDVQHGKLKPLKRYGIDMMSLGFIAGEETPVIWRGPMVTKLVQQFLNDVAWGDLDYLVVDLPPGTGDAQLTLAQAAPLAGAVIVTTPQAVALEDVMRGIRMFEKVNVPVVGIIENMSGFVCGSCGAEHPIFDQGGGEQAAEKYEVPLLGKIPLDTSVRAAGDKGTPLVLLEPDSPVTSSFRETAGQIAAGLSVLAVESVPTV